MPSTAEWVNPNEATVAELPDGRVMLNARSESKANRRLVTIRQDADWQNGYCTQLYSELQYAQLMALPWCLSAKYFAWAVPACAAIEGGAMTLRIVYLIQC